MKLKKPFSYRNIYINAGLKIQTKTIHDEYLEQQMLNPEFRAYYALAREKTKIEFMIEDLLLQLKQDIDKKIIIKNVKKLNKYISKITL